jgi:hypothetical protein
MRLSRVFLRIAPTPRITGQVALFPDDLFTIPDPENAVVGDCRCTDLRGYFQVVCIKVPDAVSGDTGLVSRGTPVPVTDLDIRERIPGIVIVFQQECPGCSHGTGEQVSGYEFPERCR